MSLRNKSHRIYLLFIFICLFISQVQASQQSDIDVIGLKLGMSQEQVVSALKKHNKDFNIRPTEHKAQRSGSKMDPLMAWREAAKASSFSNEVSPDKIPDHLISMSANTNGSGGNTKESLQIEFSKPPLNNVVKHISRRVGLGPNGTLKTTILTALTKKYGAPTNKGWQVLVWNYTNNDNSTVPEKCNTEIELSIKRNKYWQGVGNTADCGLVLTVEINENSSGIVHMLSSVLVDYSALRREKLSVEQLRIQTLEEQKEQNKNNAKKNSAPKL
jgi:hypothetical protein